MEKKLELVNQIQYNIFRAYESDFLKNNYYTFDKHKIDFVIQYKNNIIPIEVKSNRNVNNISLTRYNEKKDNNFAIRFSMNNLKKDGKIINIPLFLAEYIEKFINL